MLHLSIPASGRSGRLATSHTRELSLGGGRTLAVRFPTLWVFAISCRRYDPFSKRFLGQAPEAAFLGTMSVFRMHALERLSTSAKLFQVDPNKSSATHSIHRQVVPNTVLPATILRIFCLLAVVSDPLVQLLERHGMVRRLPQTRP